MPSTTPRATTMPTTLRKTTLTMLVLLAAALLSAAPTPAITLAQEATDGREQMAPERTFPVDTHVTGEHQLTVKGVTFPYSAEVGMQPVWDNDGKVIASLFYTYYKRTDISDAGQRPLAISFNGGPGSASVWMHIGYTGPRKLLIDPEGFPIQPYGVVENPDTILDVTDIVYVNPVNVAFSRIVGDADRAQFFGVNEDISYLSDWLGTFVSRHDRWRSPKFLIGESYGTTRVSGLARELQNSEWMYLNGVILVSPTGLGVGRDGPVGAAIALPNYTATAWFHERLDPELQSQDLETILSEVEEFVFDEYLPALARGGSLPPDKRQEIAHEVALWSGTTPEWVMNHNLAPQVGEFRKELLRDQGLTVGRLDARYRGRDRENAGESYNYDPAMAAWNQAFSPAINAYLREELGWKTDLQYWLFGPVRPWNRDGDQTGEALRQAMAENPFLHLMVQSGYYDGGTTYFAAKYTMWNLDPAGDVLDRAWWKGYRSGHMMYLRAEDLVTSNQDIRDFIAWSMDAASGSARH